MLHATLVILVILFTGVLGAGIDSRRPQAITEQQPPNVRHIVFLAPELPKPVGGGGGGGNQQQGPIRRAQSVGSDAGTLRVRKRLATPVPLTTSAAPVEDVLTPSIVLDARSLASGVFEQIGLPTGGVSSGTSTGPGSGGGVGFGEGSGIGSGRGAGLGPASGGGTGGGVYRPGGSVTAPRVLTEVKPTYTSDALRNRIQGTVVLELIVRRDGTPVTPPCRPLVGPRWTGRPSDCYGRAVAIRAGAACRRPGCTGVLVTVMLDFRIR